MMQRVVVSVSPDDAPLAQRREWVVSITHWNAEGGEIQIGGGPIIMPAVKLLLDLGSGKTRTVTVPHPGELGADALTALLIRRARSEIKDVDGVAYGRWLHSALFGSVWPEIEALADGSGLELALKWAADDYHLNALTWEAMYAPPLPGAPDGAQPEPLAGLKQPRPLVAFTRLITPKAPRTADQLGLPVMTVPRVLFAMGAKSGDEVVRPGAMFLGMLRTFEAAGTCVSRVLTEVSWSDLKEYCDHFKPEIVHLVAHGVVDEVSGEVRLMLDGNPVNHEQIKGAVGDAVAIFLSACDTGRAGAEQAPLAAQLVRDGVPIVAGMAGKIGVGACRLFTKKMVEAVASGNGLIEGSAIGRRAALLHAEDPASDLDWGLPTVFMTDELTPECRILNTGATTRASKVIRNLKIARNPIFCGRSNVLDVADALLPRPGESRDDGAARGLFVIHSNGSFDKLGSRRLLREIACRFVRAGHVPLLLGPFSSVGPTTFSQLVGELLQTIGLAREVIGLPRRWPGLLGPVPGNVTHAAMEDAINRFKTTPNPDPRDLRHELAPEFESLVQGYAAFGAPFGPHTHVAVLGDSVHEWGTGLKPLLDMVTDVGLGIPGAGGESRLVPLLITALFDVNQGIHLAERKDELTNVGNFRPLEMFDEMEAIAAYNWTLLHPWNGGAYIAKDGQAERWDTILRNRFENDHYPVHLETALYDLVKNFMYDAQGPLRRIDQDDDAAIRAMSGGHP
jgi:CHAT domain